MKWKSVLKAEPWLSAMSLAVSLLALGAAYLFYETATRLSSETRSALQTTLQQELARQRKSQELILSRSLEEMKSDLDRLERENQALRTRLESALSPK